MKKRYIIEIETKPRKFTEKDFDKNQDYDFNDNDFDMSEQVDNSFHCAFKDFLENNILQNEDIEEEVINGEYEDELPIKDFNDLGSVSISLCDYDAWYKFRNNEPTDNASQKSSEVKDEK